MGVVKDSKKGGQIQRGRGKSSKGAEETQRGVKFSGRVWQTKCQPHQ